MDAARGARLRCERVTIGGAIMSQESKDVAVLILVSAIGLTALFGGIAWATREDPMASCSAACTKSLRSMVKWSATECVCSDTSK